jgi:hypothetical protein
MPTTLAGRLAGKTQYRLVYARYTDDGQVAGWTEWKEAR